MSEPQPTREARPSPYAPPTTNVAPDMPGVVSWQQDWREASARMLKCFVAGLLMPIGGAILAGLTRSPFAVMFSLWACAILFVIAVWNAFLVVYRVAVSQEPPSNKAFTIVAYLCWALVTLAGACVAFLASLFAVAPIS